MKHIKKTLTLLFICLSLVLTAQATLQDKNGAAKSASDPKHGEELFKASCKQCHYPNSKEDLVGPGLQGLFKEKKKLENGRPVTEENVRELIKKGGNGMPGFGGKYKDAQIDDIIAYLKTL